jgi:hypothetical protein
MMECFEGPAYLAFACSDRHVSGNLVPGSTVRSGHAAVEENWIVLEGLGPRIDCRG